MAQKNLSITEAQSVTSGSQVIISGRKFTTSSMEHDPATVYLTGTRGGFFFLREYTNRAGLFAVVALNSGSGEALRNKSGDKLEAFIVAGTLTDMTGVKRVK
jgi:hypothetical protein